MIFQSYRLDVNYLHQILPPFPTKFAEFQRYRLDVNYFHQILLLFPTNSEDIKVTN